MMELNRKQVIKQTEYLKQKLRAINYNKLPISNYNKTYINKLLPHLDFYFDIYSKCIEELVRTSGKPIESITLIDYGGGSGFLSLLAKLLKFKNVIYLDINPLSSQTIGILSEQTGIIPDAIVTGDVVALRKWCASNEVHPDGLISIDVIEHVYNLYDLFSDLMAINEEMPLIFTTASNPKNHLKCSHLRKIMKKCEQDYYTKRLIYIQQTYDQFSEEKQKELAKNTRGLNYEDISLYIKNGVANNKTQLTSKDKYNTCDPETGNCTERILSFDEYETITSSFCYDIKFSKGFFNTHRDNLLKNGISYIVNQLIKISGKSGFWFAPFILLTCSRKRRH